MHERRLFLASFMAIAAALVIPEDADAATRKRSRRGKKRRANPRKTTLPTLQGSPAALDREEEMAVRAGLRRFATGADIRRAVLDGSLVTISSGPVWKIDRELGENDPSHKMLYRHALPCVRAFMRETAKARPKRIRDRYLVTSLVRSHEYQQRIRGSGNPNAVLRSSHCYGTTIDFRTTNLSVEGLQWMRQWLAGLERDRLVQATEEVRNGCFHVAVRVDFDNRD